MRLTLFKRREFVDHSRVVSDRQEHGYQEDACPG